MIRIYLKSHTKSFLRNPGNLGSPTGWVHLQAPGSWLLYLHDSPPFSLIPRPVLPGRPVSSLSPRDSQLPLCFYSGAKPGTHHFRAVIEGGSCLSASRGGPSSHAGLWARRLHSGFSLSCFLTTDITHYPHDHILNLAAVIEPRHVLAGSVSPCKTCSNSLKS